MTLNPQCLAASNSKPPRSPRSKSSGPLKSSVKIQVVELIDFDFKNYPNLQVKENDFKQDCKYCHLKQRFAKPGETVKCLTHLMDSEEKDELTFSPKTPPSKPKKRPYEDDGFQVDKKQQATLIQKLKSLSNQLCSILQQAHKKINLSDQIELVESLLKPLKYIPEDCKPHNFLTRSQQTSILNQNQSTIQFQLSSFEESYIKKDTDDSIKNMMNYLLKQSKQNHFIRAETITSFIHEIQLKLKISQQRLKEYENRIQQLSRSQKQKISTDHTIKQLSDDFNFIDRFSEFGDMSLKEGRSICLMCRNRMQSLNEDISQVIAAQGHTLESLIRNT